MIFKRAIANLRAQNWVAISIEVVIVVVGVFIGTQVSNWNTERLEKRETQRMLSQLEPSLQLLDDFCVGARVYYRNTRQYAATALAGWQGDRNVSDRDFVAAAYQASQISGIGTNSSTLATVLGADQLRTIDDLAIRNDLSFLMSADYSQLDVAAVNTPYRQNIRRLIPVDVQDAIRAQCGDRQSSDKPLQIYLPADCNLKITPAQAAESASVLRAHPELMKDLQWQVAAEAALLSNMVPFEVTLKDLRERLAALPR